MKNVIGKYRIQILTVLFLAFISVGALNYMFHYPDERHYTDASISMLENSDYLTPYKSDGTKRFLKPILTYWFVAGSYKIFGVSPFSSRFFFWLIGGLIVLVTYYMAKMVSNNKEIAWLASLITATNPLLFLSASRSIPDILQVFFLTLCAWGFMALMVCEHRKKVYYWMAYMGTALAFETKGIPAVAFAGTSILFLLFNPWKKIKLKDLIEPVSIMASVVVALGWFIIMYFKHGATYLDSFFNDQVGERVSFNILTVGGNMILAIVTLLLFFTPWFLALLPRLRHNKRIRFTNKFKPTFAFIVSWILLIIIMSGLVFKFYDRYVLPVIPAFSIIIAYFIFNGKNRFLKTSIIIFVIINILIIVLEILFLVLFKENTILLAGIIMGISTLSMAYRYLKVHKAEALTLNVLFLFFNIFLFMYPIAIPDQESQIINELETHGLKTGDDIYVYGDTQNASKVRVDCNDKYKVISMDTVYTLPDGKNHALVFRNTDLDKLETSDYKIAIGSVSGSNLKPRFKSMFTEKQLSQLRNIGENFLIAVPNDI